MIMFHLFYRFCVPVPFISGYLSTFLGEYAIFWGKNLVVSFFVAIFAAWMSKIRRDNFKLSFHTIRSGYGHS